MTPLDPLDPIDPPLTPLTPRRAFDPLRMPGTSHRATSRSSRPRSVASTAASMAIIKKAGLPLARLWPGLAADTSTWGVNDGLWFVLTSWDLDVPHQTHPQNPIHTSLTQFETV